MQLVVVSVFSGLFPLSPFLQPVRGMVLYQVCLWPSPAECSNVLCVVYVAVKCRHLKTKDLVTLLLL